MNEKQKNLLKRSKERSEKLLFFVDALLEITKIKLTRELKMEEFSFSDSVRAISEDMTTRAKNKNINFEINIDSSIDKIKGVRIYIEEAISNLLANSIKYTPQGGEVGLEVGDRGNNLLIKIKDTGIGIPKDELAHIFDEFYRARNARKIESKGTGLGLSITRQIIEMHKGKIWVESEEGKGTKFYIELPKLIR